MGKLKKLSLNKETLLSLNSSDLALLRGGNCNSFLTGGCTPPAPTPPTPSPRPDQPCTSVNNCESLGGCCQSHG